MDLIPDADKIFLKAAHDGNLDRLKRYASVIEPQRRGGGLSIFEYTRDKDGRRALHHAASGGKLDVLKYLIEEIKVKIDAKDGSGYTPLALAATEGRFAAVYYLLKMGVNPEIPSDSNCSPLHHAAMKGHKEIIVLLLSKGINVDIMNEIGSPLLYATTAGEHDAVKVLLDHGANPNLIFQDAFTSLRASIYSQSWQCAEVLLKAGADPNGGPDGIKPLPLAAELGAIQIIKLLIDAGADPNYITDMDGLKPIELAASKSDRRGVETLFPVTSPIPSYVDWSINGIMKHATSEMFKEEMDWRAKENFPMAKSKGTSAFKRKKYWLAVYWYSKALNMRPDNATVLSNRSLCYVCLNKVELAFEDAAVCLRKRPDWPKAFYRTGIALELLNRLDAAAVAFSDGLKLDPQNKKLQDALRILGKPSVEAVVGSEVHPIVLKTNECLDPPDAPPVEGAYFSFGTLLADAERSENDEHPPPTTCQQTCKRRRTRTPESPSSATTTSATTLTPTCSSQPQLEGSETDDEDDLVHTTDDEDLSDTEEDLSDGISSGDEGTSGETKSGTVPQFNCEAKLPIGYIASLLNL